MAEKADRVLSVQSSGRIQSMTLTDKKYFRRQLGVLILAALFVVLSSITFRSCAPAPAPTTIYFSAITPVPEPSTYGLWAVGLLLVLAVRRRQARATVNKS